MIITSEVINTTVMSSNFLNTLYFLHDTKLDSVSSAKYLGVTILDDLSWSTHIDNITKSANQTLCFLKRNIQVQTRT